MRRVDSDMHCGDSVMVLGNVRSLYRNGGELAEGVAASFMVVLVCTAVAVLYPPLASNAAYVAAAGLFTIGAFGFRANVAHAASRRFSVRLLALYVFVAVIALVLMVV